MLPSLITAEGSWFPIHHTTENTLLPIVTHLFKKLLRWHRATIVETPHRAKLVGEGYVCLLFIHEMVRGHSELPRSNVDEGLVRDIVLFGCPPYGTVGHTDPSMSQLPLEGAIFIIKHNSGDECEVWSNKLIFSIRFCSIEIIETLSSALFCDNGNCGIFRITSACTHTRQQRCILYGKNTFNTRGGNASKGYAGSDECHQPYYRTI
mmetsp:Transcript_15068/g.24607  ORF Transcript_15068/g.24607 Transcript_15068/m.24607 type:complete len:207 (+) Transcript_15068:191-811(+)